jgi:hypothetical protein
MKFKLLLGCCGLLLALHPASAQRRVLGGDISLLPSYEA